MPKLIAFIFTYFLLHSSFGQILSPAGPIAICAGQSQLLTVTGGSPSAFKWQLDGNTIGSNTSSYSATASGSYTVILNTGANMGDTLGPVLVTVNPLPVANFTFSSSIQCSNVPVVFTNTSTGADTYSWNFGDINSGGNNNSGQISPAHTFIGTVGNGTQNFTVSLTATNIYGCKSASSNSITTNQIPDPSIEDYTSTIPFTNCGNSNFKLVIDNTSSTKATNTFYNIVWGDGSAPFSSATLPLTGTSNTYTGLGYFTLNLKVTGQNGCISSKDYSVYNGSNPQVPFSNPGASIGQCVPFTYSIPSLATNNPPGTIYIVSKNDGTPDEILTSPLPTNYVHTFTKSSCGATGGITPNTFKINIRAQNPCGFSDLTIQPITTSIKPIAGFSMSPNSVACVNAKVTLTNTSIQGITVNNSGVCNNVTILNWTVSPTTGWSVVNGAIGDQNPTNNPSTWGSNSLGLSFVTAGKYNVSLIVRNTCGNDTITKQICIVNTPASSFTIDQTTACTPLLVNTTNTSNTLNDCTPATYLWSVSYAATNCGTSPLFSFTNNTNSSSLNPSFSFANPGTYTITLSVTNACGTVTSNKTVIVKRPPTVAITPITNSCAPGTIHPIASVGNCGNTATTYAWSFPGGSPSSSTSLDPGNIIFNTPGNYDISLKATNECGTTSSNQTIIIKPIPNLVVPSNMIVCPGTSIGPLTLSSSLVGATFSWTNDKTSIGLATSGNTNIIPVFTAANTTASSVIATITCTVSLNGCSSSLTFTITVNPKPSIPTVISPVAYCQGATANSLAATATSGNSLLWYTTATGGTGNSTAPIPSTITTGNTIYYVSQVNTVTNCEGPRAPITVTINPALSISNSSAVNPTICGGTNGSIILEGLSPSKSYTVNYLKDGIAQTKSIISNVAGVLSITGLSSGSYTNVYVVLNSCASAEVGPFSLSDPTPPATPTATANGPLCSGQTLTLLASTTTIGTAVYTWSGPNSFNSSNQNPTIPNAQTGASGTYNVSVKINGCSSPAGSVTVVINTTPTTPLAANNGPLCDGQPLNLTATIAAGNNTYEWVGPNSFTSALQNPIIPNATIASSGIYTVKISAATGNCVSQAGSTTVLVKPTPIISSSLETQPTTCNSTTGTIILNGLSANTSYIVNYKKNGVAQTKTIISGSGGVLTIPGLTAGSYTNVYVVLNNCSSVEVGPFSLSDPTPPVTPLAASNGPLCSNQSLNLSATTTTTGIASYKWSGPNGFISSIQNPTIANVSTAANGTYTVSVSINGCNSPAANLDVLIDSTPVKPVVSTNGPICSDSTLKLFANTVSTGAITWSWTGPNGFSSSLRNPEILNATSAANGLYSVTATSLQGNCLAAPGNSIVVVNPTPVIGATSFINPSTCNSSTGSITLNGLAENTSYTINYLKDGIGKNITLVSGSSGTITINNLSSGTYSNMYVLLTGCRSLPVGPFSLSDPNPPIAPVAVSNSPVCIGDSLKLNVSTTEPGLAIFSWTGPNGFSSIAQSPVIKFASAATAGNYFVTVTINSCTSPATSLPVVVNALPEVPTVTTPVAYCINTISMPLTANPLPGNTLLWYNTPQGGIAGNVTPIPSTLAAGRTFYYVSQKNSFGCEGPRDSIRVLINPDAIARFIPADTIKCPPFTITKAEIGLQVFPLNNSSYEWYVNNVLIGTGTIFPGHTIVSENDSVSVKLKTISLYGCKADSMSRQFYTYKLPKPSFELSDTVGCGPLTVKVLNTTSNIGLFTYYWNFGNGQTSSLPQPGNVIFLPNPTFNDTIYHVTQQIFSICDTITVTRDVRVKSKPKALFTPSRTVGCSPMNVIFKNTSLGSNSTYYWDFGDGSKLVNNTLTNVQHTFHTGIVDTFYVKLVAVNECGTDSTQYALVVAPNNIFLNFAVNGPQHFGCAPHTVSFINNSKGANSFNWDFGDGNILSTKANIDTIYHTYLTPGNFNVSLRASNNCTDTTTTDFISVFAKPAAVFIADQYLVCKGSSVNFSNQSSGGTSYVWEFGDGATSTSVNPFHIYTSSGIFTVKLTVFSSNAPGNFCTDIIQHQVQVVDTLPGFFTMSDSIAPCAPLTITFVNKNRPSVTSNWNFGDGTFGIGDSVVHTYTTAGNYNVLLSVTVPGGCTYIMKRAVNINGPAGNLQYTGGYQCYPNAVRMEVSGTGFNTLRWDFGDGTILNSTQQVVFHSYTNPGFYLPKVTLQNSAGCNFQVKGIDTIKLDKIDAGFSFSNENLCGETRMVFKDTSSVYFGAASVRWNFGDGSFGTGVIASHTYFISGTYNVQMIISSKSGCIDTVYKTLNIQVYSAPVVTINASSAKCTGENTIFKAVIQSTDPINLKQWTISNGVTSNGDSLKYIFTLPGSYTIRLIVGSVNGCYDTAYHTILIKSSPVVQAGGDITLCRGNSAQLTVSGAPQYNWSPLQGLNCTNCSNPIAAPLITTPYVVEGINSAGCSAYDTVIITVIQPLKLKTNGDDSICIGQSTNLLVSGGTSYKWTPSQGLNNSDISNPTASPVVTTNYRVVGYDGYNCFTDTAFIIVAVGQYPSVDLGQDKTLSTGTIYPLASTVKNGPIKNWLWTPATNLDCINCPLPNALIKNDISYVVLVTNIYGCSATDTINIKVFCKNTQVFVPNAFSPDGDGINDILMVRAKGIVSVKTFRIFNRWGELVFERNNFVPNNPAFGWDGRIRGKTGPPEVYVYTAEVLCENGIAFTYKGNTTILK